MSRNEIKSEVIVVSFLNYWLRKSWPFVDLCFCCGGRETITKTKRINQPHNQFQRRIVCQLKSSSFLVILLTAVNYFCQKAPSEIFDGALSSTLNTVI